MAEKENLTKSYIYKALTQLLEKKKYDEISVCDIAAKAGVSRMSFYRNFSSKDDVVLQGLDNISKNITKKLDGEHDKTQYLFAKAIFEEFRFAKNIICSFKDTNLSKTFGEEISKKLAETLPNDYMSKTSKYIPVFMLGAIASTLLCWLKNGAEEEPEEMAKMIASLLDGV